MAELPRILCPDEQEAFAKIVVRRLALPSGPRCDCSERLRRSWMEIARGRVWAGSKHLSSSRSVWLATILVVGAVFLLGCAASGPVVASSRRVGSEPMVGAISTSSVGDVIYAEYDLYVTTQSAALVFEAHFAAVEQRLRFHCRTGHSSAVTVMRSIAPRTESFEG